MVLVFFLAVGLLGFESMRIGIKSSELKNPDLSGKESPSKKNEGNLNRLDPTTKVIGGVRQRKLDQFTFISLSLGLICVVVETRI